MIVVLAGCAPIAWFVDVRNADAFADLLRRGGVLGVEVRDGAAPINCDACGEAIELERLQCPDCHRSECSECGDAIDRDDDCWCERCWREHAR